MNHKIFVYGTLRTGKGPVAFVRGRLYNLGHFPGLTAGEDQVKGEIIEVNEDKLKEFDNYEGYYGLTNDLYKRVWVVASLEDGSKVRCWVYRFNLAVNPDDYIASVDGIAEWTR